jgi:hypothetical protein
MPSIGVLEYHQKETDRPSRRIKRAGGQSLVRQQLAEWVKENVLLRMLDGARPVRPKVAPPERDWREDFIPASGVVKLPPSELGGLKFIDPQTNPNMPRFVKIHRAERARLQYELGQ